MVKPQCTVSLINNETVSVETDILEYATLLDLGSRPIQPPSMSLSLPNIRAPVLKSIIEFYSHHHGEPVRTIDASVYELGASVDESETLARQPAWDRRFAMQHQNQLLELIAAANQLGMAALLEVCVSGTANLAAEQPDVPLPSPLGVSFGLSPAQDMALKTEIAMDFAEL
ncbi:uncharacterized protein BJ171DRAFT_584856 [Polychytrium aggregatum]|uniref:uncharacterized protein n=1 Tax=Polychytrium aggregatum TaxID=110093 RepID=UPI0022FE3209|nr:uncharacterized protein BJ171DRAFT_584856 [Polychytrium aggregatum]KAI9199808.1 hypothetical protein BJ171DRAFT_584856 [Polychytrium aggregatum]